MYHKMLGSNHLYFAVVVFGFEWYLHLEVFAVAAVGHRWACLSVAVLLASWC